MILKLQTGPGPAISPVRSDLQPLIERHGALRLILVLVATVPARLTRPRARLPASIECYQLSAHLHRDIGLQPRAERAEYWRHL